MKKLADYPLSETPEVTILDFGSVDTFVALNRPKQPVRNPAAWGISAYDNTIALAVENEGSYAIVKITRERMSVQRSAANTVHEVIHWERSRVVSSHILKTEELAESMDEIASLRTPGTTYSETHTRTCSMMIERDTLPFYRART